MQTLEQNESFHKDPNNWKWGVFYYNPQDERVFLPKKNAALGITVNYAKRGAWIFTLFVLTFAVSMILIAFSK